MAININSSYDDIYNELYGKNKKTLDDALASSKTKYETEKKAVSDRYGLKIQDTEEAYDEELKRNAIQKYVNEQVIAETNANRGTTNSGIGDTERAAVQLSYANNKSKGEIARGKAIDVLNLSMTQELDNLDIAETEEASKLKSGYDSSISSEAQSIYKANQSELTSRYKSALSAAQKESEKSTVSPVLKYSYTDDNISYYTDANGKTVKKAVGYNPYTSENNQILGNGNKKWSEVKDSKTTSDAQKAVALYGAFSNGYQPKGVVSNNKHYGEIKGYADEITTAYGNRQKVWETKGESGITRFWVWDGMLNTYIQVEQSNGQWIEV